MNNKTVNQTAFSLSYDGEGTLYDKHQISALELAEIISSMNTLIVESNKILNKKGFNTEAKLPLLTVTAPIKEGSIIIDFLINLPNIKDNIDIAAVLGLTSTAVGSLFNLVQTRGNRKLDVINIEEEEDGTVTVEDIDGTKYKTTLPAVKLLNNYKVRKSIQEIIYSPGQKPNTKVSIINQAGDTLTTVDNLTINSYKLEFDDIEPDIITENRTIKFSKINLKGEKGWTFYFPNTPNKTRSVQIEDEQFLFRVQDASIKFDTSILYEVELQTTTEKAKNGRSFKKYVIKKVVRQFGAQ